jgi:Holliday junction DNA helicase RuvA
LDIVEDMMIASLNGKVSFTLPDGVVLDVNGVGYMVHLPAPLKDRLKPGEVIFLFVSTIVRQDAISLYAFETMEGREYFHLLIGVDGIGPKLALNILSVMTPDAIRRAVFSEQADLFSRVPGVGKRTAQKIQLYLQDKVTRAEGILAAAGISDVDTEVLAALTALGYSVVEAQSAIQSIPRDAPEDVESRLRLALQYFASP